MSDKLKQKPYSCRNCRRVVADIPGAKLFTGPIPPKEVSFNCPYTDCRFLNTWEPEKRAVRDKIGV